MEHDIHEFVRRSQVALQEEYTRIRKRASEDPGTAGDQGEENWATLLRQWLPQYFHVVTKGRVITDNGYVSPQVDVLVLYPSYPRLLLDKKLYLSGGVAAAFECKTTLTAADVKEAVKFSAELKRAIPKRQGTPYKELHAGIVYGLLAHSHSWKGQESKPIENIRNNLHDADQKFVAHPRECIDYIAVSDLATWSVSKMSYVGPSLGNYDDDMKRIYGENGCATSAYMCASIGGEMQTDQFSPIGALLSGLFSDLAWIFSDMRPLEEYFRRVNLLGSGKGGMRLWDLSVYSDLTRKRVNQGRLSNGAFYDEWGLVFM